MARRWPSRPWPAAGAASSAVRSALLGMLAGGTNISAEENSASATLSSTVMAAAKSRQAAQPPA